MNDTRLDIYVCVKQVPDSTKVEVDETTGVLKRDGVDSKMNPYDLYALEAALRLKESLVDRGASSSICAVTMGPPQADAVLKEAIMMGCDRGVLLTDRRFAGSDVLATSYALSQGIRRLARNAGAETTIAKDSARPAADDEPRAGAAVCGATGTENGMSSGPAAAPLRGSVLVICGKQTTDGDTAQVGPEIAEFLGIPHITNVRSIPDVTAGSLVVESELPGLVETAELSFPCLIAVEKDVGVPRLPSYRRKVALPAGAVIRLGLDDLEDPDPARYGIDGSPTKVVRIFPPPVEGQHEVWTGNDGDLAGRIYGKLAGLKFLEASL